MPSRRQFVGSVGAGLLLAPFINMGLRRQARGSAANQSSRVLFFCTMGTYPPLWTPTEISGESITTWSAMTQPLSAVQDSIVLVEGMPTANINDAHQSPDGLTGWANSSYFGQGPIRISVDQFIANSLVAAGINRPISSLLLGANTSEGGGNTQFYGGASGTNLPTITSPLSAYTLVFGKALPTGTSASALLARRQSILDTITAEIISLQGTLGKSEKAKLDIHLESIRELENKLTTSGSSGGGCIAPAMPGADSTLQYMGDIDALKANAIFQSIITSAFACDMTRVAALEYGDDQRLIVNTPGIAYDDQHSGYLHSGMSSNWANLVLFEAYLCTQFVAIINTLKALPDPVIPGKMLFDTTLLVWTRDMGDAVNHSQKSMRFVLASGNQGYLKTAANGRYINSTERHERILLNICEAMGITNYTGFGDPTLPTKAPLADIAA
jgi:hypothetical protein